MSFYNRQQHLLYVNEYGGHFLRIDGAGNITQLRNGDDNMLRGIVRDHRRCIVLH
jgi:hypothetical protein